MSLHSPRLTYRVFEPNDEPLYLEISMDDDLMKYIRGKGHTEASARARFKKVLAINEADDASEVYAVFHKETKDYVGLAKFTFTKKGQAEIGYVLRKAFWGQQYGTEISKRMVRLSETKKGVEELIALIDPENNASRRILEKCGFVLKEMGTYEGLLSATYHLIIVSS